MKSRTIFLLAILWGGFCLSGGLPLAQTSSPAWRLISSDPARRIEVDTASIRREKDGSVTAASRLIMAREVSDARTGEIYKYIQTISRYDCQKRTVATLQRSFVKASDEVLRTDEIPNAAMLPVRSRTLDDSVLRELCRPPVTPRPEPDLNTQLARIRAVAEAKLGPRATASGKPRAAAKPETAAPSARHAGRAAQARHPAFAAPGTSLCKTGQRQSPIDIRDGIVVDLEPLMFDYRDSLFGILDTGETIEVRTRGNRLTLLGKIYELERLRFHRPAGERIAGRQFAMSAHLEHVAADGERLIVAVLLEKGDPNAVVQILWNHLPLERFREVRPPATRIDLSRLLPEDRGYHAYMGSLPRPPCTEGVFWAVLQTPVTISPEQDAIFARLYPDNARPAQPAHGRLIKSSRNPANASDGNPVMDSDTARDARARQ
ncbi:MAG: carbonic anhydrase family protein [Zoogloeaceae bacterium]|jgi:carbonic anhydrase|nr:carbonic anhydrase family protein [Zoogloeaceae bacterium]